MINKTTLTQQWIDKVSRSNRNADKILVEKVIRALLLLAIREFRDDFVINNFNQNGNFINYQFVSVDKLIESYERLLKEKDDVINILKQKSSL